jgi:type IV pilus assembly protein PilN
MSRLNLAARPFDDIRPVWVTAAALLIAAGTLTAVSLAEFVGAKGAEKAASEKLQNLLTRRAELSASVEKTNRELAKISWKKLDAETVSLKNVVARRKLVWSQLLADLERVMPWDVRLITIAPTVDPKGTIKVALTGLASGREAWLKLLATLFADRRFSDPLPQSEETAAATSGQGHRFQLVVDYWPEGRP